MDVIGRVVFVDARVNGQGPFRFILDTGASETVITPRLAKQLGVRSLQVSARQSKGRVDSVAVGKATVEDLPVYVYDPPQALPLRLDKGVNYHGLLGYTFLRHFVTTVDYADRKVRLRLAKARRPPRPGPPGPDETRVPFTLRGNLAYVRGSVNGRGPVTFLFDTGSAEILIWPHVAESLGLSTAPMPRYRNTAFARIEELGLGSATATNLPAIVRPAPARPPGNRYHGILGYPYLSQFSVTVDYRSRVVTLAKKKPAHGPGPRLRLRPAAAGN